jgi:signal transduction histidine kinase
MGAPRARAVPDPVTKSGSAATVLDFAVGQIMRDDTALGALPAVLARLVSAFGLRAALAFQPPGQPGARQRGGSQPGGSQPGGSQLPAVLAMDPPGAVDEELLARIGALTLARRDTVTATTEPLAGGAPASVLLVHSVPVGGQCLCALALIGDVAAWDDEVRATAHAVAAIVATQIRHANDIARLERSHAAVADQTERLNCLIASAIPGVLITDEQGTVTNVSESFGEMFGLAEPSGLCGMSAVAVVRRIERVFADPVGFSRRIAAVVRARQPLTGEQTQAADGRTIESDYWPVLVDGVHRGDIWLAWDMSDRSQLEQQRMETQRRLTEQNERLRKLDEARNQFLAIVSHELRTPLTSIVSFTELIRSEADRLTPDGVRFLDIIERNADRLHRLVGDLLMLDRLEAGALPLDLAPVSVEDLAAEAVRSASAAAAKQGIAIDFRTGTGPAVPGDQRRLMQVMDNLIANAVKFSHRNQRVGVTAEYDGRQWRIDVADRGIGIPEAEAGQLFSRFVRASNARTAGLPGTGLGLSIVKVLTEMHGGHVDVASTLGQGSTFTVYLPAPKEQQP